MLSIKIFVEPNVPEKLSTFILESIKEAMLRWEEQIIIYLMRVKSNPELGILSLEDMIKFSKFNHYYKTGGSINAIS